MRNDPSREVRVAGPRPSNRYLLHWIRGQAGPGSRVLDFGCGNGAVVFAARAEGFDAYGAETYYDGARPEDLELVRTFDSDGSLIRTITGGVLNFPDASFDLVVANQVFEHVRDLEAAGAGAPPRATPGGDAPERLPDPLRGPRAAPERPPDPPPVERVAPPQLCPPRPQVGVGHQTRPVGHRRGGDRQGVLVSWTSTSITAPSGRCGRSSRLGS